MEINQPTPSKIPSWLKRLQESSWEAEILISGGAIFTLLSLSDYLLEFVVQLKFSAAFSGLDIATLLVMVALKGITVGFILHIILRGIWISIVCLNYSFPQGINFDRLKLSGWYNEEAHRYKLTDQIVKLDHISGIVFFASFSSVFFTIGYVVVCAITFVISGFLFSVFNIEGSELSIFLTSNTLYLLFLFDLLSSGWLRTNVTIGKIYYPVYRLLNLLSLAFLYRPWFQIVFSNVNRVRAFIFCALFLVVTIGYANVSLVRLFHWKTFIDTHVFESAPTGGPITNTFYENRLGSSLLIFYACIPSETISGNYFRLFVPYRSGYDDGISDAGKKYFSEIVKVSLNEKNLDAAAWIGTNHEVTGQKGIFTMIPTEDLPKGKNTLTIEINDDYFANKQPIRIFFWKE